MSKSLKELVENKSDIEKAKVRRLWNESAKVIYGPQGDAVREKFEKKIEEWIKNWDNPLHSQAIKKELDDLKALAAQDFDGINIPQGIDPQDLTIGYMFNIYSRTRPEFLDKEKNTPEAKKNMANNNLILVYLQNGEEGLQRQIEKQKVYQETLAKDAINIAARQRCTFEYLPVSKENSAERNALFSANNILHALTELKEPSTIERSVTLERLGNDLKTLSENLDKLDPNVRKKLKEFFKSPKGKDFYNNAKKIIDETHKQSLKEIKSTVVPKNALQIALSKFAKKINIAYKQRVEKIQQKQEQKESIKQQQKTLEKNVKGLAELYVEAGKIAGKPHTNEDLKIFLDKLEKNPLIGKKDIIQWRNEKFSIATLTEVRNKIMTTANTVFTKAGFDKLLRQAYHPKTEPDNSKKKSNGLGLNWAKRAAKSLPTVKVEHEAKQNAAINQKNTKGLSK